jgi:hypothetical protein
MKLLGLSNIAEEASQYTKLLDQDVLLYVRSNYVDDGDDDASGVLLLLPHKKYIMPSSLVCASNGKRHLKTEYFEDLNEWRSAWFHVSVRMYIRTSQKFPSGFTGAL